MKSAFLLKRGAQGPTRKKWRRRYFVAESDRVLYFSAAGEAADCSLALGQVSLAELVRVTVVAGGQWEWEVLTERRCWSFKAENEELFASWVAWFEQQCQARRGPGLVLPIEGFMRKKGEKGVVKTMKVSCSNLWSRFCLIITCLQTRYFRQVGGRVYYFKTKQDCMDPRRAQGFVDLANVKAVSGTVVSATAGLLEVDTQGGRVYELEVPMADFDRTLKSFCAFSPAVFVANWPPSFTARILEHSLFLLRHQPEQINTFLHALFSRTNVFEEQRALTAVACVDQWLYLYAGSVPLDVAIMVECVRAMRDSELCSLWIAFLEMVYRHFATLTGSSHELRVGFVQRILLEECFEFAFLHWSVAARWSYHQLLAAAVKEDADWKALVMDKMDAVDLQSPYCDLGLFKEAVEAVMGCGEQLPPLRPLPAKSVPAGIVLQTVASTAQFKD